MHSLIIFASGGGTNARAIIDYFKQNGKARVALIVCNKPGAGVLNIAAAEGIPVKMIDRETIHSPELVSELTTHQPSMIVLAGFLWKVPDAIIQAFSGKVVNIHPALLPLHGGKGMYGHHVHNAVLQAGDAESGITIHYVNEVYDSGNIIVQARCSVDKNDTADTLAQKIHRLEHFFFPRAIDYLLLQQ